MDCEIGVVASKRRCVRSHGDSSKMQFGGVKLGVSQQEILPSDVLFHDVQFWKLP